MCQSKGPVCTSYYCVNLSAFKALVQATTEKAHNTSLASHLITQQERVVFCIKLESHEVGICEGRLYHPC